MYDVEDTIELYEAKEKAHKEGFWTGIYLGVPLGTIGTLALVWYTKGQWLLIIQ